MSDKQYQELIQKSEQAIKRNQELRAQLASVTEQVETVKSLFL